MKNIVLFGAPGVGKGTHANILAEKYDLIHLSTGDMLRAEIEAGTPLGKRVETAMERGDLVGDDVVIGLVDKALSSTEQGVILDGFPRTIPQAQALTEALEKQGARIDYAIDIEVPDDHIVERMSGRRACPKCGATYHIVHRKPRTDGICDVCGSELILREDDHSATVQKRLDVYHSQTQPLIQYYREKGVLHSIDGTREMDTVFSDICSILE